MKDKITFVLLMLSILLTIQVIIISGDKYDKLEAKYEQLQDAYGVLKYEHTNSQVELKTLQYDYIDSSRAFIKLYEEHYGESFDCGDVK